MFHPSAQKGTKILLKKSSITSGMQSNNSANDIGMPRISSTSSNLSGLGGSSNNLFFGTGGKAVAYHDGTNFSIVNNTGHSYIGVGVGNKDLFLNTSYVVPR